MSIHIKLDDKSVKNNTEKPEWDTGGYGNTPESNDNNDIDTDSKRRYKFRWWHLFVAVLLPIIGYGAYYGYNTYRIASDLGFNFSPTDIVEAVSEPELKKDASTNITSALIVGIDTRDTNQGLQNTDSIIYVAYNHNNNEVSMISIPRDTYVSYLEEEWYVKVNGIYNYYEQREEGTGLDSLIKTVETYVGHDIHYAAMIDVNGLEDVIDILGGVEVDVENSFTDYAYPNEESAFSQYQTVSFQAGLQEMDGDTAVKYARSRKSLDNGEGTDFARARRQQRLITAVKNKVLSSDTLLSPNKILELMREVEENLTLTEFSTEDLTAALALAQSSDELELHSVVLDPTVGNWTILQEDIIPESYSIGPVLGLGEYKELHRFINSFIDDPKLYSDNPSIFIYDGGLGFTETAIYVEELSDEYKYHNFTYQGTLTSTYEGVYVYQNSDLEVPELLEELTNYTEIETKESVANEQPEEITTKLNGEDIVIILGGESILE